MGFYTGASLEITTPSNNGQAIPVNRDNAILFTGGGADVVWDGYYNQGFTIEKGNAELFITSQVSGTFILNFNLSAETTGANNAVISFEIYRNGERYPVSPLLMQVTHAANSGIRSTITASTTVVVVPGDKFQIFIYANANNISITAATGAFIMTQIGE
jgi:hypothetical protein